MELPRCTKIPAGVVENVVVEKGWVVLRLFQSVLRLCDDTVSGQ